MDFDLAKVLGEREQHLTTVDKLPLHDVLGHDDSVDRCANGRIFQTLLRLTNGNLPGRKRLAGVAQLRLRYFELCLSRIVGSNGSSLAGFRRGKFSGRSTASISPALFPFAPHRRSAPAAD